jgi:hypothetical protein
VPEQQRDSPLAFSEDVPCLRCFYFQGSVISQGAEYMAVETFESGGH